MYLKSIEVYGFKSFANRIIFKFEHGITGIVGPNGSGKSNVADAVRWVLGEQSAKQLRGAKMEDVIFSGTELRKPHGSAYVAITLDNSDHSLPTSYEEVTVARRVYRSGESEYLINGTVCRLKDVTSLFFDTGIGKEGYSIIGQGQIEKILSGKPEDRRELFDEAAGIVKYKKNKMATEKSLESERQNLYRVNDILKELEHQVGPLKDQSEVAKKYLVYKEELKQFDVNAFLLEKDKVNNQIEEYNSKLKIVNDDNERLTKEYDDTKEQYEKLEEDIENYSNNIDNTKNHISDLKLENERFEGEIKVLNQQINNAKLNDENINSQLTRINNELLRQKQDKDTFTKKQNDLKEKLSSADTTLNEAKTNSILITNTITNIEAEIEKSKADIIDFINENSTLKAKVGRYDAMLENINYRKTQLNQRYLQFKSDELSDKDEYNKQNDKLEELEKSIDSTKSTLDDTENKLNTNIENNRKNREEQSRLNQELSSKKSKLEALRNITERYDGYGNSIKKVMEQKATHKGIVGVVADIIKVNKEYEIAVETALGGSIQNIVTEDEATAKAMIRYLKDNRFGRATFLPMTSMKTDISFSKPAALKEKGSIGLAADLVSVPDKYKGVISMLLGRILVVDNIDNAIVTAKKYGQSLRIVTTEGELLTPGGAMTGGAFRNTSNLLGRNRELEELKNEISKLSEQLYKTNELEITLKSSRDELKESKENLSEELHKLYLEKNTVVISIEQLSKKLSEAASAFASVQKETKELETQIEEIDKNKNVLYDSNEQHEKAKASLEERITDLEDQLGSYREELKDKNEKVSLVMLEFNTIKQQNDFMEENLNRIIAEEKKLKEEFEFYDSKIEYAKDEIEKLNEKIVNVSESIEKNKNLISKEEALLEKLVAEKNEISISHKEFFGKREALSEEIAKLDKSSFRISQQIEKITEQAENLSTYMWEEYELTYNQALELKNDNFTNLESLKKELSAVKNKIKSLGDVNVNAIEEYKSVSERYEFLKTQHDDIIKAEENLKSIIAELDTAMRKQFEEKFAEIQHMFDKVFKELFGGGKASLELVEEEDILEAGIRIIAQPPGKKLQNMMQLSGGEKSLTAIALLFAIQSLKPSPFCLLDEIEAALDDSNVKRFAKYLSKLTKDTQFIVITHRKGTMESADILYGITMQEKGVSTLVSVNLIENDLDK